ADQGLGAGSDHEHDRRVPGAETDGGHDSPRRAEFHGGQVAGRYRRGDGQRPRGPRRPDGGARGGPRPATPAARAQSGFAPMTDVDAGELAKRRPYDWAPLVLLPLLALAALPLIGSVSTWTTLTAAGLAMGMIIFIIASGLTLVFGLMDVLNFGHGAFISVGAYVAAILLVPLSSLLQADSLPLNIMALLALIALAMAATGLLGWA